ncbi:MAG: hypothetical protein JW728_00245 [Candidatus Aureabacteria bacterium]|nr:hypothetical protein [Candidatus Auribacterota bacterium]
MVLVFLWSVLFGAGPVFSSGNGVKIGLWCEFLPYSRVKDYIRDMGEQDITLILHIGPSDIGNPDLVSLLKKAEQCHVDVRAWFLLPYEEDLYFCEDTLDNTEDFVNDFIDWVKRDGIGIKWVVFDCEPTPSTGREFFRYVREKDIVSFIGHLKKNKNEKRFKRSVHRMNKIIGRLHKEGFFVAGTSNRMILEGLYFRNISLQDSLNVPFTMLDWDELSFLVYRYKASQIDYLGMVKRYAKIAKKYFGGKGVLDIGLIGDNRKIPENEKRMDLFGGEKKFTDLLIGIDNPLELAEIVDIIKKNGLSRVNVYSLDGIAVSGYSLAAWFENDVPPDKRYFTHIASIKAGLTNASLQLIYNVLVGKQESIEEEFGMSRQKEYNPPGKNKSRL